jgi:hypothetical protein
MTQTCALDWGAFGVAQLLFLHATLHKSAPHWQSLSDYAAEQHVLPDQLAQRLATSCEVLTRIRNSTVASSELNSTLDAVLAVLHHRNDTQLLPSIAALEQCMCLLHALCWCSVEDSSFGQTCFAPVDANIATRLSTQCVELVCSLLLDEHARSLV